MSNRNIVPGNRTIPQFTSDESKILVYHHNIVSYHPAAVAIRIYFQLFTVQYAKIPGFKIKSFKGTAVPLNFKSPDDGRLCRNI
jgi:hypothetical protein